jgi:hypothetical protein
LYDVQNHFNPKKYQCQMIHVPVPVYPINSLPSSFSSSKNQNENNNTFQQLESPV